MKYVTLAEKPLPMSKEELPEGIYSPDFVYVTGDAYIDHPSFGSALISRVLESYGFTVGIISQPDYKKSYKDGSGEGVCVFGRPRLGFLVSSGNVDSMVANYTAAKKRRSDDYYSPGKKAGLRPDRAVIVYCNRIREAYGDIPIIIGGLEASLRRFAHYDYWDDKVRRSILIDSRADIISYGMGERSIPEIAKLLDKGVPVRKIRDIRGTVVCVKDESYKSKYKCIETFDYDTLKTDKKAYAKAFKIQYENQDFVGGKAIIEFYDDCRLIQNPPSEPLSEKELDAVYALPFTRTWHPKYDEFGGIAALDEVEFSVTHNRGCFGACAFCAIAYNQGRNVVSRSAESVVAEAELLTKLKRFKGYIHDVGGPTANFRHGPCKAVREGKKAVCNNRRCLSPTPCKNLIADHTEYVDILRRVSALPKIKKVFVRSGVRFDYVMADKDGTFLKELVKNHVSGQLKVAPEHISPRVLAHMGKPNVEIYNAFCKKYFETTKKCGLEQYLVPYLMSSHPGSTLSDAIDLALYLKKENIRPEQVQDFYPTPGTASTAMYYSGIDPFSGKSVYIPKDYEEKRMQRALLQYNRPENRPLIEKAIKLSGRADAYGPLLGRRPQSGANNPKNPKSSKTRPGAKQKRSSAKRISAPDYSGKTVYGKGTSRTRKNGKKR
ncbi:MAG: YgiQ family radical SAM protein [Ruminococcaceae bacterium]|nr:YgiQ family radical SAM protein [Oscillospiraceae bacterium]